MTTFKCCDILIGIVPENSFSPKFKNNMYVQSDRCVEASPDILLLHKLMYRKSFEFFQLCGMDPEKE
ncbi:hypothetical protein A2U01_0072945, partial [Trifolium medium]|nr:hypothetical protein [Trifolium medium]